MRTCVLGHVPSGQKRFSVQKAATDLYMREKGSHFVITREYFLALQRRLFDLPSSSSSENIDMSNPKWEAIKKIIVLESL